MLSSVKLFFENKTHLPVEKNDLIDQLPASYSNFENLLDDLVNIIELLKNDTLHLALDITLEISKYSKDFAKSLYPVTDDAASQQDLLSKREKEVLRLIFDGCTNKEIASKLFISFETVKSHRKHILTKTGSKNTAALVARLSLSDIEQLRK